MSASEDDGSFGVCSDGRICDSESVMRGVGGRDAKRAGCYAMTVRFQLGPNAKSLQTSIM